MAVTFVAASSEGVTFGNIAAYRTPSSQLTAIVLIKVPPSDGVGDACALMKRNGEFNDSWKIVRANTLRTYVSGGIIEGPALPTTAETSQLTAGDYYALVTRYTSGSTWRLSVWHWDGAEWDFVETVASATTHTGNVLNDATAGRDLQMGRYRGGGPYISATFPSNARLYAVELSDGEVLDALATLTPDEDCQFLANFSVEDVYNDDVNDQAGTPIGTPDFEADPDIFGGSAAGAPLLPSRLRALPHLRM